MIWSKPQACGLQAYLKAIASDHTIAICPEWTAIIILKKKLAETQMDVPMNPTKKKILKYLKICQNIENSRHSEILCNFVFDHVGVCILCSTWIKYILD